VGVTNKLFFGDNLDVLRDSVANESVDLIYLNLPFNSNANYTLAELFQGKKPQIPFVDPSSIKRAKREDSAGDQQQLL
jgi:hypothetical protein